MSETDDTPDTPDTPARCKVCGETYVNGLHDEFDMIELPRGAAHAFVE